MTLSEKREYIRLKNQSRRVKKEKERLWKLEKIYLEHVLSTHLADMSFNEILNALVDRRSEDDPTDKEMATELRDKATELSGTNYLFVSNLNINQEDKLRTFIEKEIFPYYNEQQANIF